MLITLHRRRLNVIKQNRVSTAFVDYHSMTFNGNYFYKYTNLKCVLYTLIGA